MADLPIIDTPPSQRLREFRVNYLPPIIFLGTLVLIVLLWKDYVSPPTMVAQVEPIVTAVTSRNAGVLTNLLVERFQEVRAGEIVAEVRVTDHRRYDTDLELLRSQVSLTQLELATLSDRQRLALDYENIRVDYMRQQTELQMAKAQLPHAEFDVEMSRHLLSEKMTSEFEYHYFLSTYDSLKAQADQLTKNVDRLEQRLQDAGPLAQNAPGAEATQKLVERLGALEKQQQTLEVLGGAPLFIEAPISGTVMEVLRRPGENLLPGDPILTISSKSSDRIVGYLRPPFAVQPKTGMAVEIRPRNNRRLQCDSRISGVGASLEVIKNPALMLRTTTGPAELGLPVAVSIPASLRNQIVPGELIDVLIQAH